MNDTATYKVYSAARAGHGAWGRIMAHCHELSMADPEFAREHRRMNSVRRQQVGWVELVAANVIRPCGPPTPSAAVRVPAKPLGKRAKRRKRSNASNRRT